MVCAEAICSSLHGPHAERALVRPVLGLLGCAEIFTKERDCRRKVAWLDVKSHKSRWRHKRGAGLLASAVYKSQDVTSLVQTIS